MQSSRESNEIDDLVVDVCVLIYGFRLDESAYFQSASESVVRQLVQEGRWVIALDKRIYDQYWKKLRRAPEFAPWMGSLISGERMDRLEWLSPSRLPASITSRLREASFTCEDDED